ncbi:hypothetical protein AAG906_008000 [Vitis piasezkii]
MIAPSHDCIPLVYVGLTSIPLLPNLLDSTFSACSRPSRRLGVGSSNGLYRCTEHSEESDTLMRADGCVPPEGMIASARDFLKSAHIHLEPPSPCRSIDTFSLGLTSWIRVEGRLIDMDSHMVTAIVLEAMTAAAQQSHPDGARSTIHTTTPPPGRSAPQAMPFAYIDPHAHMDRLERGLSQLAAKFRMPDIERYTGIGCPRLHLRLYSTVMRAHGLDEPQMITLFPLSLSGAAQRWFASLEASRHRTWDDLAQEFLRQFSFNAVVDISRRELEALRQRAEECECYRFFHPRPLAPSSIPRFRASFVLCISSRQPRAPRPTYDRHILHAALALPYYASCGLRDPGFLLLPMLCSIHARPAAPHPRPRAQQTSAPFALRTQRQFSQIGMPLSQALRKLTEAGLLTTLTPRPPPQPIPPQFRMDLHCAYHQGPGHETDRCTALRHAVQDLIDQGLVHLGQPSVTTNPLPAHTTHAVPPPADDIHFLEFDVIDDHIHMLSDDDSDLEPIMPDVIYEMSGVTLGPRMPAPFRLVPEAASVQAATVEPLILPHYSVRTPFILIPDVEGVQVPYVDDSQTLDIQYVLRGGRVMRQPPPAATARPLGGTSSQEEVRAEDDEILRQLQSTQARISIWSLLASSSTHRDALTRALSQIRVDTTTTPRDSFI